MKSLKDLKPPVTVRVVPARGLPPELGTAWARMQAANEDLSSPFFSPAYASAVGAFVLNTEVGVLERDGVPLAFLPFERSRFGVGKRLRLCDYQGLICPRGCDLDARLLIKGCGLAAWDFDHLRADQLPLQSYHRNRSESPILDLSQGYDRYLDERRRSGRMDFLQRLMTKTRKLEREAGELRFEVHVDDEAILKRLLQWRAGKYISRHSLDLVAGILGVLHQTQTQDLKGTLSVLSAKDEVVAAHFGLRSRNTWHWWFPAYNPEFEKYSPGLIFILKMAEHSSQAGVRIIDFGKGDQPYKRHFMNGAIHLAEGWVEVPSVVSALRSLRRRVKEWLALKPRIYNSARTVVRLARKLGRTARFDLP